MPSIKLLHVVAFLSTTLTLSFHLSAQDKASEINKLVQSYTDLDLFTGSVLVAKKGKIILRQGYGLANREKNTPNTATTKFRIASLTKQFIAMLILQLKQAGKLDTQQTISQFLPYYRKDVGTTVTIHHLLTHTSGIPDYVNRPDFFPAVSKQEFSPQDFVTRFCSDKPTFAPGTSYSYTNSGYYILGAIIESITHKPYEQVLQEQIFTPLGMKNSGIDKPSQLVVGRANGYNYEYGNYSNADVINMSSVIYAAGAIYSTVEDMLLWNNSFRGEKLLSKENKALMLTPSLNKYAYGIIVNKTNIPGIEGERTLTVHTGGINGFRSIMLSSVEDEEVIIILSNSVRYNNFGLDLNPISNRIFSILHNLPYELPKASIASIIGQKTISETADKAIEFYRQVKSKASSDYDFSTLEGELNSLGYFLLGKVRTKDAIAIFKLNTEEFPNSWNAFDSYAEALAADQQKELAIKYYRKSLELNPDNSNAVQQIDVLSKSH